MEICWLIIAVILFILALFRDEELRAEMNIRTAICAIMMVIALYQGIMWICKSWIIWCM